MKKIVLLGLFLGIAVAVGIIVIPTADHEKDKTGQNKADYLTGLWGDDSQAFYAIYNKIKIDQNQISWGRGDDETDFACKSKYEIIQQVRSKSVSDYFLSIPENLKYFEVFKLKLLNPDCDFKKVDNPHIHKALGFFQFSIPVEMEDQNGEDILNYEMVGFNDYDKQGNLMGFASIKKK